MQIVTLARRETGFRHRFVLWSSKKLKLFLMAMVSVMILANELEAVTIFDANFDNSPFTTPSSLNAVTAVSNLGTPTVGTWQFSNLPVGRITVNSNSTDKAFAVASNVGKGIPHMTQMADVGVTFGPLPDTEIADSGAGDVVKAVFSQPGRFSQGGEQTRIKFDWGTFGINDSVNFKYGFVAGYDASNRQVFELLFQSGYAAADRNLYARSATDALTTLYMTNGVPQGSPVDIGIPDSDMNSIGAKPSDMLKVIITLRSNQVSYGFDRGILTSNLTFNLNSAATNITELRWSAVWNASLRSENKGYWLDNVNASITTNSPASLADHLIIDQQPVNTAAGQNIPRVIVWVTDQYGNLTSSDTNVTVSIGNNPVGGTLGGTLTVTATNGMATFGDLAIDNIGSGYTLVASANGLVGTNSTPFDITSRSWQSGLDLLYTNGTDLMPYRLYLPWHYDPAKPYPLILFLNGAGSAGTDNTAQVIQHIAGLIARTYSDYPAILVAPQSTSTWWWDQPDTDLTFGVLAEVRRHYPVDDRRIYLTGLSNGGTGAGLYAYGYPTLFAAVSPMSCGIGFTADNMAANQPFTRIPTWLFHGSADTTLSVNYSRNYYMLVAGLTNITFTQTNYGYPTAISGPIRYTEFTGKGHDIWELIYAATNTDFYDWMFSQTRPPSSCTFNAAFADNGQLVIASSNSVPFATSYLLTSTNFLAPIGQWRCIATNWCDANGNLAFTNDFKSAESQRFYLLKSQ